MNTTPPAGHDPEQWLTWLADQPCTAAAVDTAIEADMTHRIMAAAVGLWIAKHRLDQVAERIASDFARLEQLLPAR